MMNYMTDYSLVVDIKDRMSDNPYLSQASMNQRKHASLRHVGLSVFMGCLCDWILDILSWPFRVINAVNDIVRMWVCAHFSNQIMGNIAYFFIWCVVTIIAQTIFLPMIFTAVHDNQFMGFIMFGAIVLPYVFIAIAKGDFGYLYYHHYFAKWSDKNKAIYDIYNHKDSPNAELAKREYARLHADGSTELQAVKEDYALRFKEAIKFFGYKIRLVDQTISL